MMKATMDKTTNNKQRNSAILLLAAFIWGTAFVFQSKGMEYMGPLTFNGVRTIIGTITLLIYLLIAGKLKKENLKKIDWASTLLGGFWCGLILTFATSLQQVGLLYTSVGKAGFITALYIILVPIAGIFFHKKVSLQVWVAAILVVYGLYLLSMKETFTINSGDIMVVICAFLFAAHILAVDHYAPKTDGAILSCLQFLVCGVLSSIGALIWETPTVSQLQSGGVSLLYAGVMSCGVAYTLQIIGQRNVNPTIAALIFSLESVIAAVTGYFAYKIGFLKMDQSMSTQQIIGCIIVFAAVILAQLPIDLLFKKEKQEKVDFV